MTTNKPLAIGDPVERRQWEMGRDGRAGEVWLPGTVCIPFDERRLAVGIAYADGTREMVQISQVRRPTISQSK